MITFVISKLGFGHLTRQIALSEAILRWDKSIKFQFIISEDQYSFFKKYFEINKIEINTSFFSPCISLSQDDMVDIGSSIYSFQTAIDFDTQIRNDVDWGRILENADIVINDIEFFHNNITRKMKIPTINISNFTWSDLIKPYATSGLTNAVMKFERMNDLNIKLPLSTKCESFNGDYEELGLLARAVNINQLEHLNQSMVRFPKFLTKILITTIDRKSSYQINELISKLSTDYLVMIPEKLCVNTELNVGLENLHVIPSDYLDFQNYIKIADLVIGKAGYGLISECLSSGTPILYWIVNNMVESIALDEGILQAKLGERLKLSISEVSDQIDSFVSGNYKSEEIKNSIIAKRILEFL